MITLKQVGVAVPGTAKTGRKKLLLTGLSFTVKAGTITSIVGRNGVGKSTLLRAISGNTSPSEGTIYYGSADTNLISNHELALRRAVLSQHINHVFSITCEKLLEFGTYAVYDQLTQKQRRVICKSAAERLAITGFAERPINTLSGGERQRVYLAKCLVQLEAGRMIAPGAQLLLLDEPTTALDIAQQAKLLQLVKRLALEEELAVVTVLHDLNLAAQLSDQVVLLHGRGQLAVGSPSKVFTPQLLEKAMGIPFLVQKHSCFDCPLLTTLHKPNTTLHATHYN